MNDEEWKSAKEYLDERKKNYLELSHLPGINVSFVCNMVIAPLRARFNAGERSQDLYDAMLAVE